MKIYRALSKKEEKSLLENNDILFEHKTVKRKDWLMFEHEEDYTTGKFFFFTIEDTCVYIRYSDGYKLDDSILEIEVDEKDVYKYLAFGAYYYGDYSSKGNWNGNTCHSIPELLLPYDLVKDKLKNKQYRLIPYKDRENIDIVFPYNKNRTSNFLELGSVMNNIFSKRINIEHLEKRLKESPNSSYVSCWEKELKEDKEELDSCVKKLPEVYKNFALEHSFYVCPVCGKNKKLR